MIENKKEYGEYSIVYDWMRSKDGMNLKGVPLGVYSIIFGYAESNKECYASQSYLARRLGVSRKSVGDAVDSLFQKGLINHEEWNGGTYVYTVNKDKAEYAIRKHFTNAKKLRTTCEETSQPNAKKLRTTCEETSHNNKSITNRDTKENKKENNKIRHRSDVVKKFRAEEL